MKWYQTTNLQYRGDVLVKFFVSDLCNSGCGGRVKVNSEVIILLDHTVDRRTGLYKTLLQSSAADRPRGTMYDWCDAARAPEIQGSRQEGRINVDFRPTSATGPLA